MGLCASPRLENTAIPAATIATIDAIRILRLCVSAAMTGMLRMRLEQRAERRHGRSETPVRFRDLLRVPKVAVVVELIRRGDELFDLPLHRLLVWRRSLARLNLKRQIFRLQRRDVDAAEVAASDER